MTHEHYMKRCLALAKKGIGTTRPNPAVGAVIVYKGQIIGEGYTSPYGGHHAEVNAVESVRDKKLLTGATLYVTLEPCSHFGQTPPCTLLITKYNIPKVVVGCMDDNPLVGGKGIAHLQEAGVDITLGVLEKDCREHHKRFLTFHDKKRPYVILKWAASLDGYIAPLMRQEQAPVWITNSKSRQLVHQWRAEEHAILVGANTVLQDNPSLTVRDAAGLNPVRIVIDRDNTLPRDLQVFNKQANTLVLSSYDPNHLCQQLYEMHIQSVIVEGGLHTLQSFIDAGLWDEARVFTGLVEFGQGIEAPVLKATCVREIQIENDVLRYYSND